MDRFAMFSSLVNRTPVVFGQYTVIVNSVQAEDGSGKNFIVSGQWVGRSETMGQWVGRSETITLFVSFRPEGLRIQKIK